MKPEADDGENIKVVVRCRGPDEKETCDSYER